MNANYREFLALPFGLVRHPKGDFEVTPELLRQLCASHAELAAGGYYPPIMRQHQDEGIIYGHVVRLIQREDGLWIGVEFARGMADLYDDGFLDSFSPSLRWNWEHPHARRTFAAVLREVSFVSVRHLKSLPGASPHYTLCEDGLCQLAEDEDTMNEEQMKALIAALIAQLGPMISQQIGDAMATAMGEIRGMMEPPGGGDDDPTEMSEALRVARVELAEVKIRAALGEVDDQLKADLVELAEDGERLDRMLGALATKNSTKGERGEKGKVGNSTPPSGGVDLSEARQVELAEACVTACPTRGISSYKWLQAHGLSDQQIAALKGRLDTAYAAAR